MSIGAGLQALAKSRVADVVLLNDLPVYIASSDEGQCIEQTRTRTVMDQYFVKLGKAGLKVRVGTTSRRQRIREILNETDTLGINPAVSATNTKPEMQHTLQESVTEDVVRRGNCPLMLWSAAYYVEETGL